LIFLFAVFEDNRILRFGILDISTKIERRKRKKSSENTREYNYSQLIKILYFKDGESDD